MQKAGFTLVEILLVVIIIGVLSAMVAPRLVGRGEQAKEAAARVDIESNLSTALDLYHMDMRCYPTTGQGLRALIEAPADAAKNWRGPYLKKKALPVDPWGNEYLYVSRGSSNADSYDLVSLGKDGVESADDISNR